VIPQAWTESYGICIAELRLTVSTALAAIHCGSVSCLLRPLQSDERETACGCGCLSCTALSAHLRPPVPKTSAVERTVPLFDPPFEDEWTAKKWRKAYEACEATCTADSVSTTEAETRCPACIDEPIRCEACRSFGATGSAVGMVEATGANGPGPSIPAHVLAELGMHPALVDEPVMARACARAKHEGWPSNWLTLQERAPTGFFARVLKEMSLAPGERLSVLVDVLRERGLQVGAYDAAWWSPFQRDIARAWIMQGSDRPEFLDRYADGSDSGTLGSCAACERGDKRAFTHICEKGTRVDVEPTGAANETRVAPGEAIPNPRMFMPSGTGAPTGTPPPAEAPKRGKGRPPGVKNKAPKEWKVAYTRVQAELGQ
jgi:predicted RNA-binding Zn-ribbon protein involved in translation (DUF1610 family)